ncbi:MAG: PKD domain-containing protein [bacterium]
MPHPAHEGARITLKAIIRNANCNAGYNVAWDTNLNGNYNDDFNRNVSILGGTTVVWDAGRTYVVPTVDRDTRLNVNVRVRNLCTNEEKFGTFRLFVYDFTPSNDPRNWTNEQLEIMTAMGVNEALWYLHRTGRAFSSTNQQMYAYAADAEATGLSLWVMTVNGHLPAYPPSVVTGANGFNNLPAGWVEANRDRWNADPYAETTMRYANFVIDASDFVIDASDFVGMAAGEEDNTCGYNADLSVRRCNRIAGTVDNRAAEIRNSQGVYQMGLNLGGVATVLPALAGTPLMRGNLGAGQKWEWYIQQASDLVGYAQIDGACAMGGWYYDVRNQAMNCNYSDASTSQWAYIGLESAEIAGGPYGVFVNNRHKYRIAQNLLANIRADGGAGYRSTGGIGDLKLTGGALVAARWLGVHLMDVNDNTRPFPNDAVNVDGEGNVTAQFRGQPVSRRNLRLAYNQYLAYVAASWTQSGSTGHHWPDDIWRNGDYLCGNTNAVYNVDGCGMTYTMYSLQKGFRTGQPEITQVGNHNWAREFQTYYLRAQDRHADPANPMTNYDLTGRIWDDYCERHSVTCAYSGGHLAGPMGGLVLTPTIFNPKPVAIAAVQPPVVTEGCAGGQNGRVTFTHSDSFHPNADSRIVAYQWDVDASNGLWWDNNGQPDANIPGGGAGTFEYTYPRTGNFTATLRVLDNLGQSNTTTVTVVVNRAANVPPAAAHGGPYAIEVGQALELQGAGTDGNLGCGDRLTINWDLDNDGQFDDANGGNPTVLWAALQNLPRQQPNRIRIQVRDTAGLTATAETTLTIYPREPVAVGRANPNPSACRVNVTFDGNQSFHPNPQRTIAQYDWNVDGIAGFEGSGAIFRYAYDQFGLYNVTLRVTDDLGRTAETSFQVNVNQGNRNPVARVAQNDITVLEGDPLVLDGRTSADPDANCGDSIVEYRWDINADGDWNDAGVDVAGANPTVPWNALLAAGLRTADPVTGQPVYVIRLRVTDEFGLTGTADVRVRLLQARPEAVVVQSPDPASVNRRNGIVRTALDGRESRSPVQGVQIVRFDWDLDDDGQFETLDRPIVDFQRIVPDNQRVNQLLPEYCVRLRVTDSTGRQSLPTRYCVRMRVPPTPPTADADPTDPPERAYHILLGEGVILDGSQSFDPDDDDFIRFFRWDLTYRQQDGFRADVVREDADANGAEARVQLTAQDLAGFGINAVGTYNVRLEVEDDSALTPALRAQGIRGETNTDDTTITVHPRNPTAVAVVNPNPAGCDVRITFDGSRSNHPHPLIEIAGYRWDFDGDGQYDDAQGAVATNRYAAFTFDGPIRAGLEVVDSNGNTARTSVDIAITEGNRAPVAVAGGYRDGQGRVVGPYAIAVGDDLALSAAGSNDPDAACGDRIVSYQWFLNGDAQPDAAGEEPELTWADLVALGINRAGNYDIRLVVTDRFGVQTTNVVTLRVVNGPTAVATANPNRTGCGNQVTFSGEQSLTDGPANQGFAIVAYDWDLDGDGQYDDAQGPRVTRPAVGLPDAQGNIRVSAGLRITDASGRVATTNVTVVIDVQNLPPVANAGGPYVTGPVGNSFAPVRLDGRGSVDPNAPCDQLVVYKWDTDNDGRYGADDAPADLVGAVIPAYVNPNWRVNVVSTVRLIVCDTAGACSPPAETEINVLAEAPPAGVFIGPRADAGTCIGDNPFQVVVDVSDPEGDIVNVRVVIAGQQVGSQQVDTPNDGSPQRVTLNLNPGLVPEGRHFIEVILVDANNAQARIDSGGRITFDRTEPTVVIGNELGEGVCFAADRVPNPTITTQDVYDNTLSVNEERVENGCQRTLRVTATDDCGNVGTAERTYRLAVPVEVTINGANEGQLVSQARMSWDVIGPEACANDITGRLSRNNGAPQAYPENQLINQAGAYTLNVSVQNCQGVARNQIRNFIVNAPPEAVPIPAARINPDDPETYVVDEGAGLQVDGHESRPPEATDRIARYQWDFNGDGNFDAEGAVVAYPTNNNGRFRGTLRVTDSLGAVDDTQFNVVVNDVSPIPNPGGPYVVPQGSELTFDGTGSRPGSAADPISEYRWDFGDGSPEQRGPNLTQPRHTYARNGAYVARLTVCDEDNCRTAEVRIEVRDVDPVVAGVDPPDPLYEIRPMSFTARATAGSPADPITRYEWDINGDGVPEYAGANVSTITHQFRDAGDYNITVTVFDADSETEVVLPVTVAEITLDQLIEWTGEKIGNLPRPDDAGIRASLTGAFNAVRDGRWGERYDRRGNTLLAVDKMMLGIVPAQAAGIAGIDFRLELWAMSRQMLRELTRMRTAILEGDIPPVKAESVERAGEYIEAIEDLFGTLDAYDPNYETRISRAEPFLVNDLMSDAMDAYYWLSDAIDPCNAYQGFPVPSRATPQEISRAALAANADLTVALRGLRADLQAYVDAGAAINDVAPARDEIDQAIDALDNILALVGLSIQNPCPEGERCVTDIEALRLELDAMQLAESLLAAQSLGAWTRNWQNCLVLAVKFRIELSILRVESVCGRFDRASTVRARQVQQIGLNLIEAGQNAAALEYYIDGERQCFMIEVLNACLAPNTNGPSGVQNGPDDETPNVLYPDFCSQAGEDGDGQPVGGVDYRDWSPPDLEPVAPR